MRGVISCAALLGFEELGMTEVFDECLTEHLRAPLNASVFLARQAALATRLTIKRSTNTRFIAGCGLTDCSIDDLFDLDHRPRSAHCGWTSSGLALSALHWIADAQTG